MTIDVEDILSTVEEIRSKKYPDIPEELVKQIIEVEAEYLEQRSEAAKRISKLIGDHVGEREG